VTPSPRAYKRGSPALRDGGPAPRWWLERTLNQDAKALWAAVAGDRPDRSEELRGLSAGCLLFCGSDDGLRSEVARCAAALPSATYVEVQGCNHLTTLTRADLVLPHLMSFFSEQA